MELIIFVFSACVEEGDVLFARDQIGAHTDLYTEGISNHMHDNELVQNPI